MRIRVEARNEQELLLSVAGTINAQNAKEFFRSVNERCEEVPGASLVLNVNDLEFLSSAGLRSLLQLHKDHPLRVINASPELMEVFNLTGFTRIIDVQERIRKISIEGAELVGRGANGNVYRLPDETVVKLFTVGTPLEVVRHERELAQLSLIQGLPTAIAFDIVQTEDQIGAVYEAVDSLPLSHVLRSHPEEFDHYADKYVELYRRFHTTSVAPEAFPSAKGIYHDYIDGCHDYYDAEEIDQLHLLVDSIPEQHTLIHGDYHANNIMVMDSELLMIDMGDVSYGHPVFDFLATAATQANLPDLNPAYAELHTQMPVETIRRLWNYLLDHYFEGRSADEIAHIDRQVRLLSKLKVALAPVVARGLEEDILNASLADARQNFLPRIDELVGAISW